MVRMAEYCLTIIILFILSSKTIEASKLNYPRVLLPIFDKKSINFTLEVIEKGCFKWSSSRQDLISITPIYDENNSECSDRAVVTVMTRERRRNTAIVFAEELNTVLRCDVILDIIDRLNVRTTTRQLYLEEAPETFELHAFDSQSNEFSTLEGIEFNWELSAPSHQGVNIQPALRFLRFTDSPYHDIPPELEQFEAQGKRGYKVLLEGINTGTSKVRVSMPYAEYSNVQPIEVYISVLANIIIEPSEVHILAGDTIELKIFQLKMGKLHEISLNNQYYFEIERNDVAKINVKAITGLQLGRTMIYLRDRNVPEGGRFEFVDGESDTEIRSPSAILSVTSPAELKLNVLPYYNFVTVVGELHEIAFDLYNKEQQRITLGTRYAIASELDVNYFSISKKTKNGSRIYGEALRKGTMQIYGSYKSLNVQGELVIFESLHLQPQRVILPLDTNIVKAQKFQFRAHGGDGNYVWSSGNPRILNVNSQGLVTAAVREHSIPSAELYESNTVNPLHTSIRVALAKNQKIMRQAEVFFLPPVRLEIKRYNFETALKDTVRLHVAIYAQINDTYFPYTKCDNLNFELEFKNQIFQQENAVQSSELAEDACQVIQLRSTAVGLTEVIISYKFQGRVLKDTIQLYVFKPMSILNPSKNEIVLPIGASRNVIIADGPQPIFDLEVELSKSMGYDTKLIDVTDLSIDTQLPLQVYTILCRQLGQTTFTHQVSNALAKKNFAAYNSEISINVYCVQPRFLKLYARQDLRASCPIELRTSLLHLRDSNGRFDIEVEVQDAKNRRLMNISSLIIDWEFVAGDKRYNSDSVKHRLIAEEDSYEGVRIPSRDVLSTMVSDVSPNFRIKGTVSSYNDKMLSRQNIRPESPPFGVKNIKTGEIVKPTISNEIRFQAVNNTLLPTDDISIYLSKSTLESIPILQGSGYYDIEISEEGIVTVEYDETIRHLLLKPQRLGHVRVQLLDKCLISEPSTLSVSVVSIEAISVQSQNLVERTKSIEAVIRIFDSNENPLSVDSNDLRKYELTVTIFNKAVLNVQLGNQSNLDIGEIRYVITGKNVGETKVVFSSGSPDKNVRSEPLNIEVFSPIRLSPRNTTLIIGSSIQITHQGGPKPDAKIEYYVHDKKLISMKMAMVKALKLGTTKVTGKCLAKNPVTGKDDVISEDTIELNVLQLHNIEIRTPTLRLRSGAVVPASIWGETDLSPMVLGTLGSMKIEWISSASDVIDIVNIFSEAGIEYDSSDMISVRLRARNPGRANIQAHVRLSDGVKLQASIEIFVFKHLELETPKHLKSDWILAAPHSTVQLKCNQDDLVYTTNSESNGIVSVTEEGLVHTKGTIGRDMIIARTVDQTLPIGIQVKPIHYILVSMVYPTIKMRQTHNKLPRGMQFVLKVTLHDNMGNEFSHQIDESNGIHFEVSQKDVIEVRTGQNLTLTVNLPRETSNMIAVSLKDNTGVKYAEDYIKLSVAESQHIYPTKTVFSVGDIICFDSPLTAISAAWSSSNEQVVTIDKFTGVARVLGYQHKMDEKIVVTHGSFGGAHTQAGVTGATGSVVLGLDAAFSGSLKYDVEVRDADMIQLIKSYDIFSGTEYSATLVIRHHLQTEKSANLIAKNISKCTSSLDSLSGSANELFKCRLSSKQELGKKLLAYYKVTPAFVVSFGRYACKIELVGNFNDVLNTVKTNDMHFELEATLQSGQNDLMALKFVPGIKVTPTVIEFNNVQNHEITVSGLDKVLNKVELKSSNENYFQVELLSKAHGALKYKVVFQQELSLDEQYYVTVQSPETQQQFGIAVVGSLAGMSTCSMRPLSLPRDFFFRIVENIGLLVTLFLLLVLSIWVYITYFTPNTAVHINPHVFNVPTPTKCQLNQSLSGSPTATFLPYNHSSLLAGSYNSNINNNSNANTSVFNQSSPNISGNESFIYGDPRLGSPGRRKHSFL